MPRTDPHNFKRSTIFALAAVGGGTCYWPDPPCNVPVTVFINGHPVTNLDIAHIRAAEPNGPRYFQAMTDDERRAWPNVILLCPPHHRFVDKIKPEDYPIEKLQGWKEDREAGKLAHLRNVNDLSEDRLQEIITYAMAEATRELRKAIGELGHTDPDAAMLLTEASRHINPDTADTLYWASQMLSPVLDPDNVASLYEVASALSATLNDLVPMLDDKITELRNLQGNM
jgi:hypothetical protein